MIHPDTELRLPGPDIGYGVIATAEIPAATIVWARDKIDIEIPGDSPLIGDPLFAEVIWKYAFTLPNGNRLLSWDYAKHVNHSCDPSCLSTGWPDVMIVVRHIAPGEEITDDYALYFAPHEKPMHCQCGSQICRGVISSEDLAALVESYDERIKSVMPDLTNVNQPLLRYLAPQTMEELLKCVETGAGYRSVALRQIK